MRSRPADPGQAVGIDPAAPAVRSINDHTETHTKTAFRTMTERKRPKRRTILGVIAAASGLIGATGTTSAQPQNEEPGDNVQPRLCDDSHLFEPGDWAESAITVGTCGNALTKHVRLHVDVSERIGPDPDGAATRLLCMVGRQCGIMVRSPGYRSAATRT